MYPYDNSQQLFQNQLLQSLTPQPMQQPQRHVTKVNGRQGAEAFSMPPNSDDILLDMNEPIIYFVQTDGAGYKTITPYDIQAHKEERPEDKYKQLENRISKLEEAYRNGKSNNRPYDQKPKSFEQHNDAGSRSNASG